MKDGDEIIRIPVTLSLTVEQYELMGRDCGGELLESTQDALDEAFSDAVATHCGILKTEEDEEARQLELREQQTRGERVRELARKRGLRVVK